MNRTLFTHQSCTTWVQILLTDVLMLHSGDGDCLFYAMADVANEVRDGICPGSPRQNDGQYSVDNLRNMVSQSLTENELAFFRAANDFQ